MNKPTLFQALGPYWPKPAHKWRGVLEPIVARYEVAGVRRYFRADAAFARPEIYGYLEEHGSRATAL